MILRVATFLFLIVSLASMNNAAHFAQSKTDVSNEEYAVYDAAIAKTFEKRTVNELRIISPTINLPESFSKWGGVTATLDQEEDIKSWMSIFKDIKRETIEDYEAKSK